MARRGLHDARGRRRGDERVRLGTLVASAAFRTPVSLARVAMSAQDILGGRLVLGVGLGAATCAVADHGRAASLGEMSARFADVVRGYLAVIGGAADWQGETIAFGGLQTLPMPEGAAAPELLIAAHGPRALALAVAHADTWNTYGGPGSTQLEPGDFWDLVAGQVAGFDEQCDRQGRDPSSVRRSLLLGFGRVRPDSERRRLSRRRGPRRGPRLRRARGLRSGVTRRHGVGPVGS